MNPSEHIPAEAEEEWKLSENLIQSVIQHCSGEREAVCSNNKPSDEYFIGNFRPTPTNDRTYNIEILQKLAPSAFGAEFKVSVKDNRVSVDISLSWACYYRVFPSLTEQREWVLDKNGKVEEPHGERSKIAKEEDTLVDSTFERNFVVRERDRHSSEDLFVKYKRVKGRISSKIDFYKRDDEWECEKSDLQSAIDREFVKIVESILGDPTRMRRPERGTDLRVFAQDTEDEQAYEKFISSFKNEILFDWGWTAQVDIIHYNERDKSLHFLIRFVNVSKDEVKDRYFEPFLFNPIADFVFLDGEVLPFTLELAPESFRYNRDLWGKGFNCGIRKEGNRFSSNHTPTYRQNKYITKDEPKAFFQELAKDPEPVLQNILESMKKDLSNWEFEEEKYKEKYREWSNKFQSNYLADKATFEKETFRFECGLKLILEDVDLMLAFKLTNNTFLNTGRNRNPNKSKVSWRLFQIVFFVTQIPGIAALNPKYKEFLKERDVVDIIFFPTGGGKTEAYLAVLVFNAFYDRIRGKKAGVTSWIRFPLRLLTVQQTQRLVDVIGNAELVRRGLVDKDDRLSGTPFSVGYYVGGGSTPNELSSTPYWNEQNWSIANDPIARQRWKRVFSCPSCKTTNITVEFDLGKVKLIHKCKEPTCKFQDGTIPLYVVDEEIYRYLPTVIVGTIDKLANIGIKHQVSMIFGKVDGYCRVHGYFNGSCIRFACKNERELVRKKIPGLSGPSLFIQDELHLLKEGLGTFDSHYETFSQFLLKEFGDGIQLKVIASSATIEEYRRQIRHLYGRTEARIFPGWGPTIRESFYARTLDYPQRIFVGILPHNKTIFNAILELIEVYHRSIYEVRSESSQNNKNDFQEKRYNWMELLDKYRTSLTYFLAGRELDAIKTDIEHYINPKFKGDGLLPLTVKELTGGISTDEVTATLDLLEGPHEPEDSEEAVLATSMISHGVDIDRLNGMIFYGMPRQNAEYIQSSSRVGRTHVGIVFTCLHPIRERDQSHFAYFEKYHEFLGQLVEPVAINRWSTYSIDRTLPGLFMASLLLVISNRMGEKDIWKFETLDYVGKLLSNGSINENTFRDILKQGYQINTAEETKDRPFEEKIEDRVIRFLDSIKRRSQLYKKVREVLSPSPMNSLRDVDESIVIELDSAGTEWLRNKRT